MADNRNLTWHPHKVTKNDRWLRNSHKSCLVWLTGLSASGKSTIADALEQALFARQINTFVLDGDNVRHGLNKDLGFSPEHRIENLRRVGEVSRLLVDAGILTIAAFISPYVEERNRIRKLFGEGEFVETYVKCSIGVCEERDPKGLYKKARAGQVKEFTGISAPYEEPPSAEIVLPTDELSVVESVERIIAHLEKHRIIVGD
jgi:adenylylsulfate kinase